MLTLTPAAIARIHRVADEAEDSDEIGLRVAAQVDASSGEVNYGIGFDDQREQDETIEIAGITVFVSPRSRAAVAGLIVDFVEIEPGNFSFIFYRDGDLPDADTAPSACQSGACGSCAGKP